MVPFVLPNVLKIAEWSTNDEYIQHVLPYLRDVMKLREPVQVCKVETMYETRKTSIRVTRCF